MISRCRYALWLTWRRIILRPALSILLLLAIIFIITSLTIMLNEHIGYGEAILKVFPSFLGEVGEVGDRNVVAEISIIIGLLLSISFIVIITARITSGLIEFMRRGGSMAKKVSLSGHTIICGWNFQGKHIVDNLLAANYKTRPEIVVLADYEERPLKEERVYFVKGDPSRDEDLTRAGITRASNVIVLTDFTKDVVTADAQAILIALAVESLNRDVHSCVQIMNSANCPHLRNAHVDEIICLDQVGGSLAVCSALNHGVSTIVSELLTFNIGSEIYRYGPPIHHLSDEVVGKEYAAVAQTLATRRMVLLGVETSNQNETNNMKHKDVVHELLEKDRVIIVNPQSDYIIHQDDALFIVSESAPARL
jgi:voltage-gated potassium channel